MSRYRFELASPNDDADLRHILTATPMEGQIAVAFHREPSWFAGAVVDGLKHILGAPDDERRNVELFDFKHTS